MAALCVALVLMVFAGAPRAAEPAGAEVTSFTVPGPRSTTFRVVVNGQPVEAIHFKDVHYAHFGFTGRAQIEVSLVDGAAIDRATVQPAAYGLTPTVAGASLKFELDRPRKLVLQVNHLERLFLFAEEPETLPTGPSVVRATEAGARPDGVTDSTSALQSAIDALPPGGTLLLDPGHYRSGTLRLKSDTTLHVAGGALLQALDDPERTELLPDARPGPRSPVGFIQAHKVSNTTIAGRGAIDANGYVVRTAAEKQPGVERRPGRVLAYRDCQNVTIEGVTVRDSLSWNIHPAVVDGLAIRNVKVLSEVRLSNQDGIDTDRCNNVLVEDCFIYSEDDGISPKARPGLKVVENHVYRNCVLWVSKANGIRIGTESNAEHMRNFVFEDIHILMANQGIRLDPNNGATFQNITFRNVIVERLLVDEDKQNQRDRTRGAREQPLALSLRVHVGREGEDQPGDDAEESGKLGRILDVTFENVDFGPSSGPILFDVSPRARRLAEAGGVSHLIDRITFRNCKRGGQPLRGVQDLGAKMPVAHIGQVVFE